jgi:hypothetical protein
MAAGPKPPPNEIKISSMATVNGVEQLNAILCRKAPPVAVMFKLWPPA